jgi:hypothetical protein
MPTYTVHAPPAKTGATEPERFLFLRDGFHFWAFVAPVLWLLFYRQWLALLIYLIVASGIVGGLVWLGASTAAVVGAALCISLLVGFEAATIRRWTLARRRWTMQGFVVGEDADVAERRFFSRWARRGNETAPAAPSEPPPAGMRAQPRAPAPEPNVIGLFPEPDAPR